MPTRVGEEIAPKIPIFHWLVVSMVKIKGIELFAVAHPA